MKLNPNRLIMNLRNQKEPLSLAQMARTLNQVQGGSYYQRVMHYKPILLDSKILKQPYEGHYVLTKLGREVAENIKKINTILDDETIKG